MKKLVQLSLLLVLFCTSSGLKAQFTNEGTDFWFVFPEVYDRATAHFAVNVASRFDTDVTITIPGKGWSKTVTLTANTLETVEFDRYDPGNFRDHPDPNNTKQETTLLKDTVYTSGSDVIQKRAIHVTSNQPITVYANSYHEFRSEATLILSTLALGSRYRISSYYSQIWAKKPLYYNNVLSHASDTLMESEFVVVATNDPITVEIIPSDTARANDGGLILPGIPYTVTLQPGEAYQLQAAFGEEVNTEASVANSAAYERKGNRKRRGDLSGSVVQALDGKSKFAVYTGHEWTLMRKNSRDPLFEVMYHTDAWGQSYSFLPSRFKSGDVLRVVADEDVNISIDGGVSIMVQKGDYLDTLLTQPTIITGDAPFSAASMMLGNKAEDGTERTAAGLSSNASDPSLLILNANEQMFVDTATFFTIKEKKIDTNFVEIITRSIDTTFIQLNGIQVTGFKSFSSDPSKSYISLAINAGVHTITTTGCGFLAYVKGIGHAESYSYAAGVRLAELKNNVVANSISQPGTKTIAERCGVAEFDLNLQIPSDGRWLYLHMDQGTADQSDFELVDINGNSLGNLPDSIQIPIGDKNFKIRIGGKEDLLSESKEYLVLRLEYEDRCLGTINASDTIFINNIGETSFNFTEPILPICSSVDTFQFDFNANIEGIFDVKLDFGDGVNSIINLGIVENATISQSYTYRSSGIYEAKMIYTDTLCDRTDTLTALINIQDVIQNQITSASISEPGSKRIAERCGEAVFTIELDAPSDGRKIGLSTGGIATKDLDYGLVDMNGNIIPIPDSITIPVGETRLDIIIKGIEDDLSEIEEFFILKIAYQSDCGEVFEEEDTIFIYNTGKTILDFNLPVIPLCNTLEQFTIDFNATIEGTYSVKIDFDDGPGSIIDLGEVKNTSISESYTYLTNGTYEPKLIYTDSFCLITDTNKVQFTLNEAINNTITAISISEPNTKNIAERCGEALFTIELNSPSNGRKIGLSTGGTATKDLDYGLVDENGNIVPIPDSITLPVGETILEIRIKGIEDELTEIEEFLSLKIAYTSECGEVFEEEDTIYIYNTGKTALDFTLPFIPECNALEQFTIDFDATIEGVYFIKIDFDDGPGSILDLGKVENTSISESYTYLSNGSYEPKLIYTDPFCLITDTSKVQFSLNEPINNKVTAISVSEPGTKNIAERCGEAQFTIELDAPANGNKIALSTSGSAINGTDYGMIDAFGNVVVIPDSIEFPIGDTLLTISIKGLEDELAEDQERIVLTISYIDNCGNSSSRNDTIFINNIIGSEVSFQKPTVPLCTPQESLTVPASAQVIGNYAVEWDFGDGTTSLFKDTLIDATSNASYTYSNYGNYTLSFTYTDLLCNIQQTEVVAIEFKEAKIPVIVIPNIITPNNDNLNDQFIIELENVNNSDDFIDYTIEIFSRWGGKIYSGNKLTAWDGTSKGRNVPEGVYFYTVDLKNTCTLDGKEETQYFSGHVTVTR